MVNATQKIKISKTGKTTKTGKTRKIGGTLKNHVKLRNLVNMCIFGKTVIRLKGNITGGDYVAFQGT